VSYCRRFLLAPMADTETIERDDRGRERPTTGRRSLSLSAPVTGSRIKLALVRVSWRRGHPSPPLASGRRRVIPSLGGARLKRQNILEGACAHRNADAGRKQMDALIWLWIIVAPAVAIVALGRYDPLARTGARTSLR
jgi:hypothetical protein